ncbi:hypothetical protein OG21DRAFT_1501772 [Imleria badia]|nr:hypothetical protein OG21DRAFT_1501772 [Imleria badia]
MHLEDEFMFSAFEPNYMCRWKNLCFVVCPSIILDADTLVHLSGMPALTHLQFALNATLPASNSPLPFSNLHGIMLHSKSLHLVSSFVSQTHLPAVTNFTAFIRNCPSRQDISSFLAGVGHTIKHLTLDQSSYSIRNSVRSEALPLCLEDLRPCMALGNLRQLTLNIGWDIGLTDRELLTLASAWPHLEHLLINIDWGWNTLGGITPNGLLQLLQTCQSLDRIALAIDTRGYTELPPSGSPASVGLPLSRKPFIDVLDSIIEEESVPSVAAIFATIRPVSFSLNFWSSCNGKMPRRPGWDVYQHRWDQLKIERTFGDAALSSMTRNLVA